MRKDKLLMLDDDAELCASLGRYFKTRGWEFSAVGEVAQCVKVLEDFRPDVLILDCNLGKNDREGLEFLKLLRGRRKHHGLAILVLTGARDKPEQAAQGFGLGADQYLVKPVSPRALEARLVMLLRFVRRSPAPESAA